MFLLSYLFLLAVISVLCLVVFRYLFNSSNADDLIQRSLWKNYASGTCIALVFILFMAAAQIFTMEGGLRSGGEQPTRVIVRDLNKQQVPN